MCSRPITHNGLTFACRSCDDCISTRRHGWVARAMAEKTDWPFSLVIALTYSDETEEGRLGAQMFCYADVRAFLARLRAAAKRVNSGAVIRFLCAGEQGDRNGRCHWHIILFSNVDLRSLGKVFLHSRHLSDVDEMISKGKKIKRLDWSIWGLGFVTMQEPDQGAMNYVLSYCLKDQFKAEKSKDTMRQAKAENFATGLFRMSKRPPIGENFLMRKMEELEALGAVLPALQISIPDFKGYWQPAGGFRKTLLWCLVALNQRVKWATGGNAAQWSSLLASCSDNETDMDILNGKETEQDQDPETDEYQFAKRQRFAAEHKRNLEHVERCGSVIPCRDCLHSLDKAQLDQLKIIRFENDAGVWEYKSTPDLESLSVRASRRLGFANPLCSRRGSAESKRAFPKTG